MPDKHPASTTKGMTEIQKSPALVVHGEHRAHVGGATFQTIEQLLGGKCLVVDEPQPGHGADALQHIVMETAPATVLVLEQIQGVLCRRDNHL
ncbi:hypothetical protein D3C87_1419910 [compost metagenome]